MNWLRALGLDALHARCQSAMTEGAAALEDRVALARLEWRSQRQWLLHAFLLTVVVGVFLVVALLVVSLAVLAQFWDTPQRVSVAWWLAVFWLLSWGGALWALLVALRRVGNGFALTRRELAQDWHDIQEMRGPP